jgi:hypothetical protein
MNVEIDAVYKKMWSQFQAETSENKQSVDLPPKLGDSRWGASLILRLYQEKSQLIEQLQQTTNELIPLVGDRQLFYEPDTFHTTIRSLEPFREFTADDERIDTYQEILGEFSNEFGSIVIDYMGLTISGATIMVQGWPENDSLQSLRGQLAIKLRDRNLHIGPEEHELRTTAHTSLVVFTEKIKNVPRLLQYIGANRMTKYGRLQTNKIELVKYTRLPYSVSIDTLASVEF